MTREQYLEKKEELKRIAATLKSSKREFRKAQSEKRYRDTLIFGRLIREVYYQYRPLHIFMSLVRGRTRIQIENNFLTQDCKLVVNYRVEKDIKKFCETFNYEMDLDENLRVIEIKQKVDQVQEVGA